MLERFRSFLNNDSTVSRMRAIVLSKYYPLFFCIFAFIAYCTPIEMVFGAVFVIVASIGLVICSDLRPLIPPLLYFFFMVTVRHAPQMPTYSHYYGQKKVIIALVILGVILFAAFVLHYKLWGGFKKIFTTRTHLTFFIIPLTAALLINGLFAPGYRPLDPLFGALIACCWVLLYLMFVHGLPSGKKMVEYFCECCQWAVLILIAEIIYVYISRGVIQDGIIDKSKILFGWGIQNNYGGVMAFLLPPLFYLAATRRNGWIQFLLAIAAYVCIVFSLCRSALLVGTVIFIVCVISVCFCGQNKPLFRLFVAAMFCALLVVFFVFREQLMHTFTFYARIGLSDSGRFKIWREAIRIFSEHPIFGAGFHAAPFTSWAVYYPGFCHNTVIQLTCTCGAFGVIAYLAYRVKTIWIFLWHTNTERFFLGMMVATLLGVSLLDNHMFNIYPSFYYTLALALAELNYNDTVSPCKPLKPLFKTRRIGKRQNAAAREDSTGTADQ